MKKDGNSDVGALPYQTVLELIESGCIVGSQEKNVRPASLDLSISDEIYQVEGVFQPKKDETVRQVLNKIKKKSYSLEKALVKDQMYLIRLNETFSLPKVVYGICNPKSTSGRLDAHVRLIADRVSRYDMVNAGFSGELWISVVPKTFSIKLFAGASLNQIRFFNADTRLNNIEIELAMKKYKLLWKQKDSTAYKYEDITIRDNDGSLILTLDLESECLGYEGVASDEVIDISKIKHYNHKKFFKSVRKKGDFVYLKKDAFYILSTHEAVRVPPELSCEMISMDERSGEFRSHYAGFIDPGWGWGEKGEGKGRPLTLEVRPFEDIIVRQGQPIGKIRFERMIEIPELVYDATNSNYTVQSGPKLAKHFK